MAAQVKGTSIDFCDVKINRASDDLSMFIKDTENLATYNQWSGGDYSHNTNGLQVYTNQPITITIDKDHSTNNDSSFKVVSTGKLWGFIDILITDFDIGDKIQATIDLLPIQSSCILSVRAEGSNADIMTSIVTVPQNSVFNTYSVTSTSIPMGTTEVRIRISQNTVNPSTFFMDNILVKKI